MLLLTSYCSFVKACWFRRRLSSRTLCWLFAIVWVSSLCCYTSSSMLIFSAISSQLSCDQLSFSSSIAWMFLIRSSCWIRRSSAYFLNLMLRFFRAKSLLAFSYFSCSASSRAYSWALCFNRLFLQTPAPLVNQSHIFRAHSMKFSYFTYFNHLSARSLNALYLPYYCCASSSVISSSSTNFSTAAISMVF